MVKPALRTKSIGFKVSEEGQGSLISSRWQDALQGSSLNAAPM